LSIIDLSEAGAQPMSNEDESLRIVFNGEIYNHRELREELGKKGHRFRSTSDTEVILHLYEEEGEKVVMRLRGMFAFALWDEGRKRLFIARDPFGIKPLYYTCERGIIRVASQVKALLAGGGVSRDLDPAGVTGFYLWGSVPEPYTLYREIRQLPAGSYAYVDKEGVGTIVTYWSPKKNHEQKTDTIYNEWEAVSQVRTAVRESVKYHLEADVPVGVFLSAGIDSSVMAALAGEHNTAPVRTVTLAFEEFRGSPRDESVLSAQTARQYGTEHTTITISRADFERALPDILEAMDQPSIDGVNTYFVARAAAQAGLKVALSGLGGDELFGGYPSFRNIPRAVRWLSMPSRLPFVEKVFRLLTDELSLGKHKEKMRGLLRFGSSFEGAYFLQRGLFMPWELDRVMDLNLLREGLIAYDPLVDACRHLPDCTAAFGRIAALEQSLYMRNQLLRDVDWVLHKQVSVVAQQTFREEEPKRLLASAAEPMLPQAVLRRPKTGFAVPVGKWITNAFSREDSQQFWPKLWARKVLGQF
jgi:asparagine synthase (glutamine-hydrolysing)